MFPRNSATSLTMAYIKNRADFLLKWVTLWAINATLGLCNDSRY